MGKTANELKRLSSIDSAAKVPEILDLEKHHFEEDMQRLKNSSRKPSQSHFIPTHEPLSLEI